MSEVRTTCGQCLAACGMRVDTDLGASGEPADPITRGYLCANGRASVGLLDHPGRLRTPLVRGAAATWDAALAAAANGIRRARDAGGPDAVGMYFGAGDPAGSMAFLAAAGFMQGLGSTRHYNVIGLEATHRYVVAEEMFGNPLAVPRADLGNAGGLLAVGTNPLVSNDEGGLAVALDAIHRRGGPIVVLDPRRTGLARLAAVHLPVVPGTDAEVLLALLHVIFCEEKTLTALGSEFDGFDRLRTLAAEMSPERAAAIAGVPAVEIERAARLLAGARPVTTISRLGSAMTRRGTLNEWLSWALVACLGGLGHRGGLVLNPGFLDFEGMMKRAPRAPDSILGVLPPTSLADAILDDGPGRLRALVVVAADLIASVPNTDRLVRALKRLECLIVLDVMPTPTTALASVVFPCAHHLEKDDIALLLPDRTPLNYVRASRAVRPPPGEARSEVAILADLARRLDRPLFGAKIIDWAVRAASVLARDGQAAPSPKAAMQIVLPVLTKFSLTWKRVLAGHLGPNNGHPCGDDLRRMVRRPRGSVNLAPGRFVEALEASLHDRAEAGPAVGGEWPLVLSTCNRSRNFINTKLILVGRSAREAIVHVNPSDAARLGLDEGAAVSVQTVIASLPAAVHIDATLRSGTAAIYFGTPDLNRLTDDADVDPFSHIPAVANVRCRIARRDAAPRTPSDRPGSMPQGAAQP